MLSWIFGIGTGMGGLAAALLVVGGCYAEPTSGSMDTTPPRSVGAVGGSSSGVPAVATARAPVGDAPALAPDPAAGAGGRASQQPIVCDGHHEVRLRRVAIAAPDGVAITAGGHCRVRLVDCRIEAATGVVASDEAEVHLEGCAVTATSHAVRASDNARVRLPNTTLTGRVETLGDAKVGP